MKNKFITSLLIITILLFIAFGGFFLLRLEKLLKVEQPIKQSTTRYEIVSTCETLSANATNDGWSYKNCIENLEKAAKEDLLGGIKKI